MLITADDEMEWNVKSKLPTDWRHTGDTGSTESSEVQTYTSTAASGNQQEKHFKVKKSKLRLKKPKLLYFISDFKFHSPDFFFFFFF